MKVTVSWCGSHHDQIAMGVGTVLIVWLVGEKRKTKQQNWWTQVHFDADLGTGVIMSTTQSYYIHHAAMEGRLGWTALHNAAEDGDLAVVEFLLANGADVSGQNKVLLFH